MGKNRVILLFALLFSGAVYLHSQDLAREISQITVLTDDNYPPYIFRDYAGNLSGIIVDQWALWEKKTGIRVLLAGMDWNRAQEEMKNGKGDVIDTLFHTEEREKYYDFSHPYADIETRVFFHKMIGGINDLDTLRGFAVGVKKGDALIDLLEENGICNLVYFDSYEKLVDGAARGEVKVFCADAPPSYYFLCKTGFIEEFRSSFVLSSGSFHRAVSEGNTRMLSVVEKGFSAITRNEYKKIDEKWFGQRIRGFIRRETIILPGLVILAGVSIIILILLIHNQILNRRLLQKNSELETIVGHLKASEEKNRQLLGALPDLYFILDINGKYLDLKQNNPDLLAAPPDELIGHKVYELQFEEDFKKEVTVILEKVCRDRENTRTEYVIEVPAGKRYFEARVYPYGREHSLWICRDITDEKKTASQLARSQKLETIGILAGGLAHDFNNILGGIMGAASLMRYSLEDGQCDEGDIVRYLEIIEKSSVRGSDIVNQLLMLAKKREISTGVFNIMDSLNNVIKLCRTTFDKRVSIELVPYSGEPLVLCDQAQIEQCLLNIFINAHDSMTVMRQDDAHAGGTVSVAVSTACAGDGDREKIFRKIEIKDTGVGIEKSRMPRIFDPFFSEKGRGKGTGLGLPMALSIMKQNGGEIEIESEPGKGTRVILLLPAAEPVAEAGRKGENMAAVKGSGLILIIDDEPVIRELASGMLESAGYRTAEADNGIGGIDFYRRNHDGVAAVMLDLSMPHLSGIETYRELARIDSSVKVLLTSGYREDERVKEGLSLGIRAFLQKPFTRSELLERISQICGSREPHSDA